MGKCDKKAKVFIEGRTVKEHEGFNVSVGVNALLIFLPVEIL